MPNSSQTQVDKTPNSQDQMKCSSCGKILNSTDEIRICLMCEQPFCVNCIRICDGCKGNICSECGISCDNCNNLSCEDCIRGCSKCSDSYCVGCAETELGECCECGETFCEKCGDVIDEDSVEADKFGAESICNSCIRENRYRRRHRY